MTVIIEKRRYAEGCTAESNVYDRRRIVVTIRQGWNSVQDLVGIGHLLGIVAVLLAFHVVLVNCEQTELDEAERSMKQSLQVWQGVDNAQ